MNRTMKVKCDHRLSTGRRSGKTCGAIATHFDARAKFNVCGNHREPGALRGTGTPWYADPRFECDTAGHAGRLTRRVVDGVAMCSACSNSFALDVELKTEAA